MAIDRFNSVLDPARSIDLLRFDRSNGTSAAASTGDPSKSSFVKGARDAQSLAAIEQGGVAGHAEIQPPKFLGFFRRG